MAKFPQLFYLISKNHIVRFLDSSFPTVRVIFRFNEISAI
jgi:hypothetical protein